MFYVILLPPRFAALKRVYWRLELPRLFMFPDVSCNHSAYCFCSNCSNRTGGGQLWIHSEHGLHCLQKGPLWWEMGNESLFGKEEYIALASFLKQITSRWPPTNTLRMRSEDTDAHPIFIRPTNRGYSLFKRLYWNCSNYFKISLFDRSVSFICF